MRDKKANSESIRGKERRPFVVTESEVRDYVENLGIHDVGTAAARFQIVADLTKGEVEQLAPSDLLRIKQVASEDSNRHYRRIMEAIIAGVGQGSRSINAAHLTAKLAVQMIFRWSPEYFSALNSYRDDLRKRKPSLLERSSSRRSGRRVVLPHVE